MNSSNGHHRCCVTVDEYMWCTAQGMCEYWRILGIRATDRRGMEGKESPVSNTRKTVWRDAAKRCQYMNRINCGRKTVQRGTRAMSRIDDYIPREANVVANVHFMIWRCAHGENVVDAEQPLLFGARGCSCVRGLLLTPRWCVLLFAMLSSCMIIWHRFCNLLVLSNGLFLFGISAVCGEREEIGSFSRTSMKGCAD